MHETRNAHRIVPVDQPPWEVLGPGLRDYNQAHAGEDRYENLCLVLQSADEEVLGGLVGATYWDWFYIDVLWVREDLRGQGYGHRLLTMGEDAARERGARNAYLDTFSFQAPEFYRRHGYRVFGQLDEFPPGHTRYFLAKEL